MTVLPVSIAMLMAVVGLLASTAQERGAPPASGPETFHVTATASGAGAVTGSVTVPIVIRLERYTPDFARTGMTDSLKYRGYPGFLLALRGSPVVGSLESGGQSFMIRWARQEPAGAGRTITIVTDKPVFFVGLGKPDAKSTKGYEVAVLKLDLDATGRGEGIMAAAARVKPDGTGGVRIDDYAQTPMKLIVGPPAK